MKICIQLLFYLIDTLIIIRTCSFILQIAHNSTNGSQGNDITIVGPTFAIIHNGGIEENVEYSRHHYGKET